MHVTKEKLEALLREAELAHAEYEKRIGKRDLDWPVWYADYIVRRIESEHA